MKTKKLTVVWNKHGAGTLIGVFDDAQKLDEIKQKVKKLKEQTYVEFIEVALNKAHLEGLS